MRLHRLPRVLLLHLCRFEWLSDEGGGQAAKLHGHLPFPQQLALRHGWLSDDCPDRPRGGGAAGPPRYNLQAVVTHLGKHSHGEVSICFLCFFLLRAPKNNNTPKKQNTGCESIAPPFPSFEGRRVAGARFSRRRQFSSPLHRGGPTSIANRDYTFRQAGSRYPFASTRVDSC